MKLYTDPEFEMIHLQASVLTASNDPMIITTQENEGEALPVVDWTLGDPTESSQP